MGVALTTAPRVVKMRNPFLRALLAALCVLLIVLAYVRNSKIDIRSQILQKAKIEPGIGPNQNPLDDQRKESLAQAPILEVDHIPIGHYDMNCDADTTHLRDIQQRYKLDETFQYMKRYVRFSRTEGLERKSMTKLSQDLLTTSFATIDVNKESSSQKCADPLDISVPASGLPATVDASDFMFGVSTTYKRFMDPGTTPINEWIFWLTDSHGHSNGGKLLLMLLDANDEELQEVANLLGDVGIDVDVYHSDSSVEMAVRYVNLVPTLYTHADASKKKWLVTCDDDTFFPSMHGLIAKMGTFDPTKQMYIGALSEDIGAIERHGSQAFGGAGVFLSLSMAETITELHASCISDTKIRESNSGWGPQGDILLRKCIYENTDTRLTNLWDLWQMDVLGDPCGFYEWGIKPLSLHHYRGSGWHKALPGQYTKVAHTCGEDCTMMRFQTKDDFIISGYSISHYPEGITFDTDQAEGTMKAPPENKGWNFDFKMGPQRPSLLKTGRKISWDMQESEVRADGSVIQIYTRKQQDPRWVHASGQPMSNIDGVIELVWVPS